MTQGDQPRRQAVLESENALVTALEAAASDMGFDCASDMAAMLHAQGLVAVLRTDLERYWRYQAEAQQLARRVKNQRHELAQLSASYNRELDDRLSQNRGGSHG